jgi:hypothetical protein
VRRTARTASRLWLAFGLAGGLVSVAEASFLLIGLTVNDPITRDVVERYTLTRNLQPVRFLGTVRATEWLLDRPHLTAALARHLYPPLEQYHVAMRDDGSFAVNDQGTLRGSLRLVAQGANRRVYFCQGQFRSLAQILYLSGSMVFTLEYHNTRQGDDPAVEVTPHLYVRLDNVLAHGLLKIIAPLVHGAIDRRVANLAGATRAVGERIARDADGLYRDMRMWPDIRPDDLESYRKAFLVERLAQ